MCPVAVTVFLRRQSATKKFFVVAIAFLTISIAAVYSERRSRLMSHSIRMECPQPTADCSFGVDVGYARGEGASD
jgi:hypothetical protein